MAGNLARRLPGMYRQIFSTSSRRCRHPLSLDLNVPIVEDAETLLNLKDAVQKMPSISSNEQRIARKACMNVHYYSDHVNCSCLCFKFKNLCKHSIWVAEIAGILKEHLEYLKKPPRHRAPSKSGLVEPAKEAHGKKGGSNKNPWRPIRRAAQATSQTSTDSPITQIHHNNNFFVLCFLYDVPNAKECRQCRIELPRQKITPFDVALSHEEKWLYPDPNDASRKLPSMKHTTKFYCVRQTCMKSRFPYFDSSLLRIPAKAQPRLLTSHLIS